MQNVKCAVIAAAGLGSRLGLGMPKCMIDVGGKCLLSHQIETLRSKVEQIRVVIGYREKMVLDYCSLHHPDVILVRNPNYENTNTAYSFSLGASHLTEKSIFIDGDLLIKPDSLDAFLSKALNNPILVGISKSKSENAVFANVLQSCAEYIVEGFTRSEPRPYEWANIVAGPADLLRNANGFVYERLAEMLPLPAAVIDLAEVDTADDLDAARIFAKRLTQNIDQLT